MKPVHRGCKASKLAQEDVISRMPENLITDIMNRLPIRDAMRTSILASNWRFRWTMLTELALDHNFSKYLQGPNGEECYDERNISRILLNLIGPINRFFLYIPNYKVLDVKDISHWVLFLSKKGIKRLTIINMHQTPLMLPTHLFSCLELKHLRLGNCSFHLPCSFCGFPNLLNLDLDGVSSNSHKIGKLITQCPSLKDLFIVRDTSICTVKPIEISKLGNLHVLAFPLRMLDTKSVTSSSIFQLVGCFPKLHDLFLDLSMCEASTDSIPTCAEVDYNTTRRLQLRRVLLLNIKGSNNEVCFINYLLACSPLLEKISIGLNSSSMVDGADGRCKFANKLSELHRASPVAEIVCL